MFGFGALFSLFVIRSINMVRGMFVLIEDGKLDNWHRYIIYNDLFHAYHNCDDYSKSESFG